MIVYTNLSETDEYNGVLFRRLRACCLGYGIKLKTYNAFLFDSFNGKKTIKMHYVYIYDNANLRRISLGIPIRYVLIRKTSKKVFLLAGVRLIALGLLNLQILENNS